MDEPTTDDRLRTAVRVQRIIVGGLLTAAAGLGLLFPVLHFVFLNAKPMMPDPPRVGGLPVFTLVGTALAAAVAAAAVAVGRSHRATVVTQRAAAHPAASAADDATLLQGWQVGHLVQAGLCEGPIMCALTLFLVSGELGLLAVAAAMWALLLTTFPSEASARRWLDAAADELAAKRAGG